MAFGHLAGNRVVIVAIVTTAVLFSATSVAMWTQQPYCIALGIEVKWFGLLLALGFGIGGLGGNSAICWTAGWAPCPPWQPYGRCWSWP